MPAPGAPSSSLRTIGGTPLVRLSHLVPDGAADVLVKVEGGNPTGSYKDRMALAIIEGAERRGALRPGQRVVEYTGGSTGSALAFVCAVKGYPLSLVSSDAFAPEKLRTMRAFGADVIVLPSEGGRITPELFVRMREAVEEIVKRDGAFWTDQFHNTDALTGYAGLGREILEQTGADGTSVDVFCAAIGTGGMFAGVSTVLREAGLPRAVALEPASSPMLSAGESGPHRSRASPPGSSRRCSRTARSTRPAPSRSRRPGGWPSRWPAGRACSRARPVPSTSSARSASRGSWARGTPSSRSPRTRA